jgi:hypothetical protein
MEEQWIKVEVSYESKFNIVGCNVRERCWKRYWEPLSNYAIRKIVKHKGGSISICNCTSWEGIGELTIIEGKIVASIIETSKQH